MVAAIYRILDWRPSEARQNAEVFVGRACMVVLGGALALVLSQAVAMAGMLDRESAKLAGNAATYTMLAGFAGIAMGACLAPPVLSRHGHGHGHGQGTRSQGRDSKETNSGQLPDDNDVEQPAQKPV